MKSVLVSLGLDSLNLKCPLSGYHASSKERSSLRLRDKCEAVLAHGDKRIQLGQVNNDLVIIRDNFLFCQQ